MIISRRDDGDSPWPSQYESLGRWNLVAGWETALMERHHLASRTDTTEETSIHQVPVTVVSCSCARVAMNTEYVRRTVLLQTFPPTYPVQPCAVRTRTWSRTRFTAVRTLHLGALLLGQDGPLLPAPYKLRLFLCTRTFSHSSSNSCVSV